MSFLKMSNAQIHSVNQCVAIVKTLCEIQAHTRRHLPVCCDMKVHLQLLTFLYSVTYEKYHIHQPMFSLHYGIWHPYKYSAILIWRNSIPC